MVRIPAEYQEVEYIESTGGQYIITDVIPSSTLPFYCVFSVTSNSAPGYGNVFGSRAGSSSKEYQLSVYKNGTVSVGYRNTVGNMTVDSINVVYFDGNTTVNVNGIYYTITTSEEQHPYRINLFAIRHGTSIGYQKQAGRIYKVSFGNVANFIPCYRKSDNEPGMYDTVSGTFHTNSGTGTFLKGNDVTYDPISLLETRRKILLNTPHIETASGSIAAFNTDMSTNITDLKIHFHPVQAGSGDPSPNNVRPITGWDGVTVTRCGKNLFNKNDTLPGYIGASGEVSTSSAWKHQYIFVKGMAKITISGSYTNSAARNVFFDLNMNPLNTGSSATTKGNKTLTIPNDAVWYGCSVYINPNASNRDVDTLQVEEGSTATAYEPYTAVEIPISFGRTIYGGYVDLINGEVVETHIAYDIGDLTWAKDSVISAGFSYTFLDMQTLPFAFDGNIYCSTYNPKMSSTLSQVRLNIADGEIWGRNNYRSLFIKDDRFSDAESFKGANNGQFIIVPIATPIHNQLTPQAIKVLKGINNIWSNANGNVEVKFWKH